MEHVKVLVVLNGIKYEEEEGRQLIENLMERNSVQCERVELLNKVTPAASTKTSKKSAKATKTKKAKPKKKKRVPASVRDHNEKVAEE